MPHCSTAEQRRQWVIEILAPDAPHGVVSQLSREHEVSRQTLYRWKAKAEAAIQEALRPEAQSEHRQMQIERAG